MSETTAEMTVLTRICLDVERGCRIGQACYNRAFELGLVTEPNQRLFYRVDDWNDPEVRDILEAVDGEKWVGPLDEGDGVR